MSVSRSVAMAFLGLNNDDTLLVTHKDGNKFNNKVDNLTISTRKQIGEQITSAGRHYSPKIGVKLIDIKSEREQYFPSIKNCQLFLMDKGIQIHVDTIGKLFREKKIKHGYQFLYADSCKYDTNIKEQINEQWKETHTGATNKHNDKYYVSNLGRVKIVKKNGTEKLKKQYTVMGKGQYKMVWLQTKHIRVHRLVANAFVKNPHGYFIIDHKDSDPTNNIADNLRWCKNKK
eukprot:504377_1